MGALRDLLSKVRDRPAALPSVPVGLRYALSVS
ncbi:hypothetical protein HNQ07_002019 [Deinococcus metalli]|uniref:Uncharacterized protein n=1 Tax=Deinococcus metalli TaxID=1141878 RepID=A0A7W8KE80_9DEIO|nr:hypothetical protein [Deinococcus metalli]